MATHRVGETGLSDPSSSNHHPISYEVLHGIKLPATSFINQEDSAFDFGELEEAIMLQGVKINNAEPKPSLYAPRPAATLEMFPPWPTRFHHAQTVGSSKSGGGESTDSGSAINTFSSKATGQIEAESPISCIKASSENQAFDQNYILSSQQPSEHQFQPIEMASDRSRTESSSQVQPKPAAKTTPEKKKTSEKILDAKTLRRLAQNREAARKSRLRKKAYVQQLETSRIRLTQLEQDLQRSRSQGLFVGGSVACGNISSGAAIFDMEYARWLEDDQRHMAELRTGLQANLSDGDLNVIVDGYIAHYDEIFQLKEVVAKSDVFHLITGLWTTPAERCFLWMGGFRPSELIKILIGQLDPLTEQQVMGIYSLQHSSQQAEEALSQGLEQLQHSLVDAISSVSVNDGMHHMALALDKLTNLEGFVRQADNLRQQTLHQLRRILTIRQAARCFLVIGEYYNRLRALSSLWLSRPQETLIDHIDNSCQSQTITAGGLQMVQCSQNQFSHF